jgi:DNA polymerase I-like protein with 3'-5' exonuclease and polymerase domains
LAPIKPVYINVILNNQRNIIANRQSLADALADAGARESLLARIAPIFASTKAGKIAHNLKFDLTILRHHGLHPVPPLHDSLLAHYVYDAADRRKQKNLSFFAHSPLDASPFP